MGDWTLKNAKGALDSSKALAQLTTMAKDLGTAAGQDRLAKNPKAFVDAVATLASNADNPIVVGALGDSAAKTIGQAVKLYDASKSKNTEDATKTLIKTIAQKTPMDAIANAGKKLTDELKKPETQKTLEKMGGEAGKILNEIHKLPNPVNIIQNGLKGLFGMIPSDIGNMLNATGMKLDQDYASVAAPLNTPQKLQVTKAVEDQNGPAKPSGRTMGA